MLYLQSRIAEAEFRDNPQSGVAEAKFRKDISLRTELRNRNFVKKFL